jgi:hypothetical protein
MLVDAVLPLPPRMAAAPPARVALSQPPSMSIFQSARTKERSTAPGSCRSVCTLWPPSLASMSARVPPCRQRLEGRRRCRAQGP